MDSTLRDGAQSEGISFSVEDKLSILKILDNIGVSFIEAGNPASNPKDLDFFTRANTIKLKHSKLVAFGSTRRKNVNVNDDINLKALLKADTDTVVIFGKSSSIHVDNIICTTPQENFNMIEQSCKFLKNNGKKVFFDAEHFFDGYINNKDFAIQSLKSALKGGADCLILCDTNGSTLPMQFIDICNDVKTIFPKTPLGVHTHNDSGVAVSNSIIAAQLGFNQIQGTFLGFGERCGNANLSTIIADLQLKLNIRCIPCDNISMLTKTARQIAEISNVSLPKNSPFVGRSAFAHKAGMHADGVLKLSSSFEHISPSVVGNDRRFLTSEISGRTALLQKIQKIKPEIEKNSPQTISILKDLKQLEKIGYQFEGADSSLELLIRKHTNKHKPFFKLLNYKIISEGPTQEYTNAFAMVKVSVHNNTKIMAAEGNGPVNALDKALRSALESFYPSLSKMHLIDYKVRVMDSNNATASTVRVLISSSDGRIICNTVGVSSDVVKASLIALIDSIEYKLIKDTQFDF